MTPNEILHRTADAHKARHAAPHRAIPLDAAADQTVCGTCNEPMVDSPYDGAPIHTADVADVLQDMTSIADRRVGDAEVALNALVRAGLGELEDLVAVELVGLREEARLARIAWRRAER